VYEIRTGGYSRGFTQIPEHLFIEYLPFIQTRTSKEPGIRPSRFQNTIFSYHSGENPDIEDCINSKLESCIESQKLILGDPGLVLHIQQELLTGAQGMFLWVRLQVESLCRMKTDASIRAALKNLLKSLSETFNRIISLTTENGDQVLQRRIFDYILAAYRPLTLGELEEALSVVLGDTVWDSTKLINDIYAALGSCGCLITIDEEDFTVRFIHHSVKQYLKESGNIPFPIRTVLYWRKSPIRTIQVAKTTMADTIITYLSYDVFEKQVFDKHVVKISMKEMKVRETPSIIVATALESSSVRRDIALRLLKSKMNPSVDIARTILETGRPRLNEEARDFQFFRYMTEYWPQYLVHYSQSIPENQTLLFKRFKNQRLNLLALNEETGSSFLVETILWGQTELFKLFLEDSLFDINSPVPCRGPTCNLPGYELDKRHSLVQHTALEWAIEYDKHEIVTTILLRRSISGSTTCVQSFSLPTKLGLQWFSNSSGLRIFIKY
jgi:ankyrin repeat domain-containing protein 50